MESDAVYLSYGDSVLRMSDLALLESKQWLNDRIIGFYCEYCQLDKFRNKGISFIAPEVTQCLKLMDVQELSIILEPLDLDTKTQLLFPLNNNPDPGSAGGSHWSLLVFSVASKTFHHLDSSQGLNDSEAKMFSTKLSNYFEVTPKLMTTSVTQQSNGYACGDHCLLNIDQVASRCVGGEDIVIESVSYADRNCWTCPGCDQYNGFNEDGDYNRDLDLTSGSGARFASSQNKSGLTTGNGLCHQCNLNQEVKMRSLNSFKCSNFNAKYKEEMSAAELEEVKLYEERRDYLDRTYKLCPECDDRVNSFMSEQDQSLAGQLNEFRAGKIRNKLKVTGQKFRKSLMDLSYFPLFVSVMVTVMLLVPDIQLSEVVPQHILHNLNDYFVNSNHAEVMRSQLQSLFPHICPEEAMRQLLSSLYIPVIISMLLLSIVFSTREFVQSRSKSAAINTTINALIGIVTLSSRLDLHQLMLLCCVSIITSTYMNYASKKPGVKKSPKTKKDFRSLLTPPPLILNHRVADKDSDRDEVATQDLLSLGDFTTSSPVPSFKTAPVIPHNSFVPIGSPTFGASAERARVSPAASVRSGLLRSSDEFSFTHEFATNVMRPGGEGAGRDCDLASLSLDDDLSRSPAPTTASITSEPPFSLREYSPLEDRLFKPQRKIIHPARFQPPRPTTNSWVAGGYWQPAQNLNLSLPVSRSSSQSSGFISGTASTLHRALGDFHTPAMSLASTHTGMTLPPLRRGNIEDSISDSSCPRGLDSNEHKRQREIETRNKSVLDYSISVSLRNILITLGFVVSVGTNVYYLLSTK